MTAFDTDVLSDILRAVPAVLARAAQVDPAQQYVPAVVAEETIRGRFAAIRQAEAGKGRIDLPQAYELFEQTFRAVSAFRILPYTAAADRLVQALRKAKVRVGTRDLRIAATCIVHGATLATRNARDYARVPGLTLDVWT
ncbi:MAG: nucleic acid-binding protein [Isosphaera sp.]|nr:nucleic acid-binding protein [Isosphaera sp.]